LAFEVDDLARSEWFYDRFLGRLGFSRFVRAPAYLGYSNDELQIWVIRESPKRVHRRPISGNEEVVADHLAFFVTSHDEVRAIQADLERLEIYPTFRAEEHPEFAPGYFSATWVDPNQTVIEVYSIPKARPRRRSQKPPKRVSPARRRRHG
jgi:hypothetical protein